MDFDLLLLRIALLTGAMRELLRAVLRGRPEEAREILSWMGAQVLALIRDLAGRP